MFLAECFQKSLSPARTLAELRTEGPRKTTGSLFDKRLALRTGKRLPALPGGLLMKKRKTSPNRGCPARPGTKSPSGVGPRASRPPEGRRPRLLMLRRAPSPPRRTHVVTASPRAGGSPAVPATEKDAESGSTAYPSPQGKGCQAFFSRISPPGRRAVKSFSRIRPGRFPGKKAVKSFLQPTAGGRAGGTQSGLVGMKLAPCGWI
jgi:hypothetical protein